MDEKGTGQMVETMKKESRNIRFGNIFVYLCSSVFICGYLSLFSLLAAPTPVPTADNHPLFEKAQEYFKQKKYKEAKQILNQLVAKASPLEDYIPKARLLLANLQDDFSVSIAQFKSLAAEYSNRPEGEEAQKNLGARYYLADKYQDATESYEEFIKNYPNSASLSEIRYWHASALLAEEKNNGAVEEYRRVLEKSPDSSWAPKSLLGMGNAYFKMKKYNDAEKQYLKILDQYHFYDELNLVYFKLGQTYEMENKPKESHAAYQTLVEKYPRALEAGDAKDRIAALERQRPDLAPVAVKREEPPPIPASSYPPTPTLVLAEREPTPAPTMAAEPEEILKTKPYHVQIGVFSQKLNVEKARKQAKKAGYDSFVVKLRTVDGPYPIYKVRVGHFADRASAEKAAKILTKKLREKAIVVED